jgi:hypothetical protein
MRFSLKLLKHVSGHLLLAQDGRRLSNNCIYSMLKQSPKIMPPKGPLTQDQLEAIRSGQSQLTLLMAMVYQDVFNFQHVSHFCGYWDAELQMICQFSFSIRLDSL